MQENENISTYPEEPTNPNDYEGFEKSVYYIFNLLRLMYYSKTESENKFYSKLGGVIGGNVTIQGNLVVNGVNYAIDTTHLNVGDYTITLAKDNEQTLTSMVGMVVPKYDGTNYGFFGWDADGYAYVGDLTNYDGTSNITLANNSSLQKIATIDTTNTVVASNSVIYVYDATSHCFKKPTVDNKYYVIRNGEFVESELFTSEEKSNISKSLYNLGAFDIVSGNTITRQTGYVDLGSLSWEKTSNNRFETTMPSAMPNGDTSIPDLVFNRTFTADTPNHVYSNVAENIATINSNKNFLVYVSATYYANHTAEQFIADYGDIQIQYKLATSYTENIIENQPLLNLDSNGCNWVREEWEKGLNLVIGLQSKKVDLSSGAITDNSSWLSTNVFPVKPNTIYTFTNFPTPKNNVISFYQANMAYISRTGGEALANRTFTTPANCYYAVVSLVDILSSAEITEALTHNIMLNEGSHAYPYQEYNGDIVHKVDIEPVLLWENSSPNSDMSATQITLSQPLSNFKFFIVEYKLEKHANQVPQFTKYRVQGAYCYLSVIDTNSGDKYHRLFDITSLSFTDGYINGAGSSNACVPIAIYGTNVL